MCVAARSLGTAIASAPPSSSTRSAGTLAGGWLGWDPSCGCEQRSERPAALLVAPRVPSRDRGPVPRCLRTPGRSPAAVLGHGARGRGGDPAARGVRAREFRPARAGGAATLERGPREAADCVRRRCHPGHRPDGQHLAPRVRRARRDRAPRPENPRVEAGRFSPITTPVSWRRT